MRYLTNKELGYFSSFHIDYDLVPLVRMIKAFSLKLSNQARIRLAWMDMYRECGNAAQVCRHFSISYRTFWYWKKRYDPWDLKSLENRSRRPRYSPRKTAVSIEQEVLALKRLHPRWGKEKLALYLRKNGIQISGKTVWKILDRHRLNIRYRTRKRQPPKPRVKWAEIHSPGDLLEMDVKHISLKGRKMYQYTIIDVVSRWRHAEIHHAANMNTTIKFLKEARKQAPFSVSMIQTDNGSEFGRQVSKYLQQNKIKHVFAHKGRPIENGHVERSHRTDEEEFYSVESLGSTIDDLREKFALYLNMYNTERPHWALNGQTPIEFLNNYSLTKVCKMS